MYSHIRNKKGEELYILTVVPTNDIKPYIIVNTWENCVARLNHLTIETDNDKVFAQLIHKEVDEINHTAEASMRCNRNGWGSDFFEYITIESLYTEVW